MYKIKHFSILAKTTIKTLRYYEKEKLLFPSFLGENGYRYYESAQLSDLAKIVSLRQIGLSINDIKRVLKGFDKKTILLKQKELIEKEINENISKLSKINYLLEEKNMNYEVITKNLPDYIIYYKEGIIKDFSKITEFILSSSDECLKTNPNIECVEPGYCFVTYLDGEYKDKNIKIRYSQAVTEMGKPNETIKFEKLKPVSALCVYHKGSYETLNKAYAYILKYVEENNYEIIDYPRESYIDGIWNKDDPNDWLTEIQIPVKLK